METPLTTRQESTTFTADAETHSQYTASKNDNHYEVQNDHFNKTVVGFHPNHDIIGANGGQPKMSKKYEKFKKKRPWSLETDISSIGEHIARQDTSAQYDRESRNMFRTSVVELRKQSPSKVRTHYDKKRGRSPGLDELKLRKIKTFPRIKEPDKSTETPEMRALRRLRSRLKPYTGHPLYNSAVIMSDGDLLAWLRPYNFNVYMVEARLLQHCEVRNKIGLDNLLTDYTPPEILKTYYTGGLCGEDREGRPVWYELLGAIDMHTLVTAASLEELVRFKFYQFEKMKEAARKARVSQLLMVIDMNEMSIKNLGPAIHVWIQFVSIMQDHYPSLFKEILVINPPPSWTEFALSIRPFLKQTTLSKVTVLRCNYLTYLEKRIEKHNIPAYLGGWKCDIDNNPFCLQDLNWEGIIPTWMCRDDPRQFASVRPFVIPGGQRLVKETHVTNAGCHVFWEILETNQAVTLKVYLDKLDDNCMEVKQQILPDKGSNKHQLAGVLSTRAGRYFMVLDNIGNFASAARGYFAVSVQPPSWLTIKARERQPIGDYFDLSCPIGAEEKKVLRWKHRKESHFTWYHDQQVSSPSNAIHNQTPTTSQVALKQ